MSEQTPETVSAPVETVEAVTPEVAAPVDPSETVSADAGMPGSATEPVATPATPEVEQSDVAPGTELTRAEDGSLALPDGSVYTGPVTESAPDTEPLVTTQVESTPAALVDQTPAGVDPQETATVVLDEPGHDGAFIVGNTVVGTSPVDVFAGDVAQILELAESADRKVKVVVSENVEVEA